MKSFRASLFSSWSVSYTHLDVYKRQGKIQGERLDIEITSLEYDGTIIPVELAVYDTDGQPGIFIPCLLYTSRRNEIKTRQCVYISRDVHGKILRIVNDIAGGESLWAAMWICLLYTSRCV